LTSDDTSKYIENHLNECSDCSSYFKEVESDTNISLNINNDEIIDKGDVILGKIKKEQDRIKYTFIIFSVLVAISSAILSRGIIATVPLVIIVPCILKLFYDEDIVIIMTSIITQLVISIAIDDLGYGLFTLPINVFCVGGGLVVGNFIRNIMQGRI
ncbi:MAG: hypothetical protein ACRDB0_03000, partial [Paraclostridium sp.]